jgi:hypothetical protein
VRHPVERYFTSTVSVDRVSGTVVTGPTASARAGRRVLQVLFGFATSPQIRGGEAGRSGALPFHGWARRKLHVRLDAQDRRFDMIRDAARVQIVNSLMEWGAYYRQYPMEHTVPRFVEVLQTSASSFPSGSDATERGTGVIPSAKPIRCCGPGLKVPPG